MKEKILIALNDKVLTNAIDHKLKDQGYKTHISNTGIEALADMKLLLPDLALIDLVLPVKNGYEVLIEKSLDRFITKIPVIIVSNSGIVLEMKKIPSTPSIKDFEIKTHVDPDEILKKINAFFSNKPANSKEEQSRISNSNKKILWVEDDKLLSTILSKKLSHSGFILLKASNSDEAFSILETEIPDIIMLDILLPGMNGFDILQKIKTQEKFRKIPVLILSNVSSKADIDKAKLLGAQKFIVKATVSIDEIIHEIESALSK